MSNVYIQEPPALGKVLLKTSVGDIDLELWTKEAPKACRNFIQLCMEGYYNGTIFHRVVPDFIVQGGDPSGDGTGGESIYGAPFKDEFHSRLRFNRRGLIAMANAGKDDNSSQFFFTLGATPELQNKHTIFGKVTGETVFNMLKLAEGDIGEDERPTYPHKITGVIILINPFEDIVPRVIVEEVSKPAKTSKKERKGTKNFGLLSFGAEAEEEEGEGAEFRGKAKSTHDLLDDPKLSKMTAAEMDLPHETPIVEEAESSEPSAAVTSVREKLKSKKKGEKREDKIEEKKEDSESEGEYYLGKDKEVARRKERDRIRNEISQLKKDMKKPKAETASEANEESSKPSNEEDNELKKQYEEEQEKYRQLKERIPKKGTARSKRSKRTRTKPVQRKPWVKNLYENRDYPDNYTDVKFLDELRKNIYVRKVTFDEAFVGALRVTLRLCLCVLYALVFVIMYNGWVATDTVIIASVLTTVLGYVTFIVMRNSDTTSDSVKNDSFLEDCRTVLAYLVIGYIVSPILHTLTDTVSTDTIYALTVLMMLVHLIFFDYGVQSAIVSNSLSVNAAIFSSVCLVSRLSGPFDAFVLLTVSVLVFVLTQPLFKSMIGTVVFNVIVVVILGLTIVAMVSISWTLSFYFVTAIVFINVCCPILFVRWQRYKDNIHGPWDEAIVRDSDDLKDLDFDLD